MSKHITPTRLKDQLVVIAGGTGAVGEGIVKWELEAGAKVVVLSRTMGKINELKTFLRGEGTSTDNLFFTIGDYTTFEGARDVISRVTADHGPIDHFVASIGGWWMGKKSWEISQQDWDQAYTGLSTAHMAVLRAVIPRLSEGGSYTFILGFSGVTPIPGSSLVCMRQAGLLMLRSVLSAEIGVSKRVNSLVLGPVSTRSRGERAHPDWVTSEQAGQVCAAIQGGKATAQDFKIFTKADAESAIAKAL